MFISFLFRYTGDPGKLAHLQVADEGLGGMLTSVSLVVPAHACGTSAPKKTTLESLFIFL